ncbi:MAG: S-layer homology domain-containing protein [Bacteroidales bacterium]|nr:S-layer homology domain-containing protein [Bacteroidales bacterium]
MVKTSKYTLYTAQENFLVGYPVTIKAQSNAPDVNLFLPNGTKIKATDHVGEEFTFELTAEQAVYGRYELRTDGGDKENRSVFFAAVSLADSLRHATSKGDEGEENRLIGFSSRLNNNIDNPPEVYVDGNITTMSFTPERFKTEETTLLEYGILFHDHLFARIAEEGWDETKTFNIKNLQFVTIPGFTFEISFGNIKASANNSGKEFASDFTQPISWNVERYNNGPAKVWPEIPDTKEERAILDSGGTVSRPDAPEPKATDFDAKIIGTKVERDGNKTNINIYFDSELDTREFGFGFDITDQWETLWSEDNKQVTLSIDYDKFPIGTIANLIIFRLKDVAGNMIPGPEYLSFSYPDEELVSVAISAIQGGTYEIPAKNQANQRAKTAWVQSAVNALIPEGNGSVATVIYDNGYKVSVTKGQITKSVTINVTMEEREESDFEPPSSYVSKPTPTPKPIPEPFSTESIWPRVEGNIGIVKIDDAMVNEMITNNITIEIKHVKNIGAYSMSLPVESLTDANGDGVLNVKTSFGTITIPSNMLSNLPETFGKEAVITIGEGDKTNLSEELQAALGDRPIIQLTVSIDGKQLDWNNPNAPVSVTLPYKPTEEELENPDNIVVWYINDNDEVITVPNGRYDVETGTVTFRTTHFSMFLVTYIEKNFNDLENVEWARKSIEALTAKDIIMTDGDSFYPSENITRADYLYALVRALNLNTAVDDNFEDVSEDMYYYNEIAIAKKLGITLGTGNNKFSPDLSITRQEMMTLTGRTLISLGKLEQPDSREVLDSYTDKSEIASYAIDSVAALVKEGLIVGSNNKIMPKNNTSRAEAAEFVYRLYNSYK